MRRPRLGWNADYNLCAMPARGTKPSIRPKKVAKPTPAQQRARREYVERSGHKVSAERVERIRSQWQQD